MNLLGKWRWVGLAASALCGCGGESEGSRVDTGLPESTALRDISSSDAISACENIRGAIQQEVGVEQTVRKACELFGAALTDTTDACQTQAASCVSQTNDGTNPLFSREDLDFAAVLECNGDTSAYTDCEVTVAELEGCMDARLTQVEELFAQFSCGNAATIDSSDAQGFIAQLSEREAPAACQRLQAECPRAEPFSDQEAAE